MIECSSIFVVCWCLLHISNDQYVCLLICIVVGVNETMITWKMYITFLFSQPHPSLLLMFVVSCDTELFLLLYSWIIFFIKFFYVWFFNIFIHLFFTNFRCIIVSFLIHQLDQCSIRFLFGYMMNSCRFGPIPFHNIWKIRVSYLLLSHYPSPSNWSILELITIKYTAPKTSCRRRRFYFCFFHSHTEELLTDVTISTRDQEAWAVGNGSDLVMWVLFIHQLYLFKWFSNQREEISTSSQCSFKKCVSKIWSYNQYYHWTDLEGKVVGTKITL